MEAKPQISVVSPVYGCKARSTELYLRIIYWGSYLLLAILSYYVLGSSFDGQEHLGAILNSDNLLFPSTFINIEKFGYSIESLQLPGAICLFPDLLVCSIVSLFTKNASLYFVVFSITQVLLLAFVINKIFQTVKPGIGYSFLVINNLIISIVILLTIESHALFYSFYLFVMSYHTGAFIIALICVLFFSLYISKNKTRHIIFLLFFVWMGAFSDMLFIPAFVIPFVVSLLFYPKDYYKIILGIILFAGLGVYCFKYLTTIDFLSFDLNFKIFEFSNIITSLNIFINVIINNSFISKVFLFALVIAVVMLILVLRAMFVKKTTNRMITIFSLYIALLFFVITIVPIINGSYVDSSCIRYSAMGFYVTLFLIMTIFILNPLSKKCEFIIYITIASCTLILLISAFFNKKLTTNIKKFITYYPEESRQIDSFCMANNIKQGVAEYWYAAYPEAFSKQNIRIKSTYNNGVIYRHNQHINSYYELSNGEIARYNFIVTAPDVDSSVVCEILRKPISVLRTKQIAIYRFGAFRYNRFTEIPVLEKYSTDDLLLAPQTCNSSLFKSNPNRIIIQGNSFSPLYKQCFDSCFNNKKLKLKISCKFIENKKFDDKITIYLHIKNECKALNFNKKYFSKTQVFMAMLIYDNVVSLPDTADFRIENKSSIPIVIDSLCFEFIK